MNHAIRVNFNCGLGIEDNEVQKLAMPPIEQQLPPAAADWGGQR